MCQIEAKEVVKAGQHILYDAAMTTRLELAGPESEWFESEYWLRQNDLRGHAAGRGEVIFFEMRGREFALRHYRRGGLPARLIKDGYGWTGLQHSRAWREWYLLEYLYNAGLPAPRPFAARVVRRGLFYTADLITHRIQGAISLAAALTQRSVDPETWRRLGAMLRRFHDVGIDHADLNAHNILLDDRQSYLIDFDNGKIRSAGRWQKNNLQRLLRSLNKLAAQNKEFFFIADDWRHLVSAYNA